MNVRKAQKADIDSIEKIYDRIHDSEEQGLSTIGWIRGVYPTEETAREALDADDLFVMEEKPLWSEAICSSCWMTEM